MALLGTEDSLGSKLFKAAMSAGGDAEAGWKAVASAFISYLMENATISGIAPSGGGPIVEGKIN